MRITRTAGAPAKAVWCKFIDTHVWPNTIQAHSSGDRSRYRRGSRKNERSTVVIGSVCGDLHDIGKNLVKMMLGGSGFTVVDLGVNVSSDAFIEAVNSNGASLLCMSALLTTTMPEMKKVISALEDNKLRDQVRVMVGGAPIGQAYADEIGADGYGADAGAAVRIAKSLV